MRRKDKFYLLVPSLLKQKVSSSVILVRINYNYTELGFVQMIPTEQFPSKSVAIYILRSNLSQFSSRALLTRFNLGMFLGCWRSYVYIWYIIYIILKNSVWLLGSINYMNEYILLTIIFIQMKSKSLNFPKQVIGPSLENPCYFSPIFSSWNQTLTIVES